MKSPSILVLKACFQLSVLTEQRASSSSEGCFPEGKSVFMGVGALRGEGLGVQWVQFPFVLGTTLPNSPFMNGSNGKNVILCVFYHNQKRPRDTFLKLKPQK